jgi:hypothetical protein
MRDTAGGGSDPEGGADLPTGAVLGERGGGGVPFDDPAPPPAEVDEAIEDQPAAVAGRRGRRLHPPRDARRRRGGDGLRQLLAGARCRSGGWLPPLSAVVLPLVPGGLLHAAAAGEAIRWRQG